MARYPVSRQRRWRKGERDRVIQHKLVFVGDKPNAYLNQFVFKSVRSVVLQQLLYINTLLEHRNSWLHRRLADRYKDYHMKRKDAIALRDAGFRITDEGEELDYLHPSDLVKFLGYDDIMDALHCSRRTAAEYKSALESIHNYYYYERLF
jgi:hypothetical protein